MIAIGKGKRETIKRGINIIDRTEASDLVFLDWTVAPPKKPGWYWTFWNYGGSPSMYEVILEDDGKFNYENTYSAGYIITHWLGPLPVPEPPTG